MTNNDKSRVLSESGFPESCLLTQSLTLLFFVIEKASVGRPVGQLPPRSLVGADRRHLREVFQYSQNSYGCVKLDFVALFPRSRFGSQ